MMVILIISIPDDGYFDNKTYLMMVILIIIIPDDGYSK
jgi:hypothetical protein